MDDPDLKLLIVIVLLVAVAGTAWYFRDRIAPPPEEPVAIQPQATTEPEEPAPAGPLYPIAPLEFDSSGDLVELPPLDDSDSYFLLALEGVLGDDVGLLLLKDALIDRFVGTVDNLPRAHVAEKIRPVGRLSDSFQADSTETEGLFSLGQDNFRRYDALVEQIATADIDALVDTYRRFYPLFQESFQRLGYPDAYFNDRVVEVIDHLLATPDPTQTVFLVRPNVLYEFADPDLEALSAGQKLLLRIGTEHAATVKAKLRELRAHVIRQQ